MFTRRRFADMLQALGTIVEAIKAPATVGDCQNDDHVKYRLRVDIYGQEAEQEWWRDHIASCFPTWSRLKLLCLRFRTREYTSNRSVLSPALNALNSTD